MKRKVIQLAGKTYVVSLPSKWAKQYNIKKGQELEVQEKGRKISFSTQGTLGEETKHIDISSLSKRLIRRVLGALYKVGYDRFEVRFSHSEELVAAQEVVYEEFLGFEVVHQEKKHFSVIRLSHMESQEFDIVLRRIFLIIKEMGENTLLALEKKDKQQLSSVILRDFSINKLSDFCRRVLNKHGLANQNKVAPLYFIVETLEKIGDAYRDYAKNCIEKFPKGRSLFALQESINQFYIFFYETFYHFSLVRVDMLLKKQKELESDFKNYFSQKHFQEHALFLYLIYALVFDMNGALLAWHL